MKVLIFCGGSGKRFWPISRQKMPKVFIPLFNNTSTFQLQVKRAKKFVKGEDIFIATNEKYVSIVKKQAPEVPTSNIIAEVERRDLLAALGFALIKLRKLGIDEPILYLASDHLIKRIAVFKKGVLAGKKLLEENDRRYVFFGEKPLYATNNLGWINIGKLKKRVAGVNVVGFKKWIYRPDLAKCKKMFRTGKWVWNINYEMFKIDFALEQYQKNFPKLYKKLQQIEKSLGTKDETRVIKKIYPILDMAHSDELWIHAKPSQAVVLNLNMGWSDPGTLFALKQALEKSEKGNVTKGNVHTHETKNSLVYNYEKSKLVTTMNLDGMIVVNTDDVLLVVDKNHVRFLGNMLKEFKGTTLEKYL
jgi:mannose-1-phosphate guanylyltransferase